MRSSFVWRLAQLFFVLLLVACQNEDQLEELANKLNGDSPTSTAILTANGFNLQPTAVLQISPISPLAGEPIMLNSSKSSDPDGEITSYRWEINGKLASTEGTFETTLESGFYIIKLTVFDALGASHTESEQVLVKVSYEDLEFDLSEHEQIAILYGASQAITQLEINSNQLFVASKDGKVYTYPLISNQINHATTLDAHDGYAVSSLLIWDDLIFTGSNDNTIKVWNKSNYNLKQTLTKQDNTITQMLVLDDFLLSTSLDKTIQLYSLDSLNPIQAITNSKNGITHSVSVGDLLVSSTVDNEIYLRDAKNNFQVAYKNDSLHISVDFLLTYNSELLLISKEGTVAFYSADGFTQNKEIAFTDITAAHLYKNYLVLGSKIEASVEGYKSELIFYNLDNGERTSLLKLLSPIRAIAIKEGIMALGLKDNTVQIYSNLTQFNKRF